MTDVDVSNRQYGADLHTAISQLAAYKSKKKSEIADEIISEHITPLRFLSRIKEHGINARKYRGYMRQLRWIAEDDYIFTAKKPESSYVSGSSLLSMDEIARRCREAEQAERDRLEELRKSHFRKYGATAHFGKPLEEMPA